MSTASLSISGMNCASCVAHVSKAARSVPGVADCTVNLARGRAVVEFDPAQTSIDKIAGQITSSGYPAEVAGADANGQPKHHHTDHTNQWLRRAIAALLLWLPLELAHWCMQLFFPHAHAAHHGLVWIALVTSTLCLVYVGASFYKSAWTALRHYTTNMDTLIAMGASVAYFYSLIFFLGGQFRLWSPPTGDELYFMESSALLALISLGHWLEANARRSAGSAIQGLLNLAPATALRVKEGERSTLNAQRPTSNPEASLERWKLNVESWTFAQTEEIPVSQIQLRDTILLRPGDRVPVDGTVIDGSSSVDESFITGEPLPVSRTAGDKVVAGTSNLDGRLMVRATAVGSETALAHIIAMVEKAQESRPPVQRLADQVAAVFVPVVLCIALVTGIGWFVWGGAHHWATAAIFAQMAKTVCSVLLIACPCALGLAVPAAIMVGTGAGARRGILIRDIDALQNAEKIDTVVLDKTGTITEGKPVVVSINSEHEAPEQLLRLAAAAEQFSSHPLAEAIVSEAKRRGIEIPQPSQFNSHAGYGVMAVVDGRELLVGNEAMLERFGQSPTPFGDGLITPQAGSEVLRRPGSDARKSGSSEYLRTGVWGPQITAESNSGAQTNGASEQPLTKPTSPGSIVYVAEKRADSLHLLGKIEISDPIKPDTAWALDKLRAMGLRLVMLTGDNARTAAAVAGQLGITEIHADVRPVDKAAVIRRLQADQRVAMVGDGINDAPALATANLGIALGSGSDIAKETGGIVLVGGSLSGVAASIQLSRATMRVIRQNLFLAFIYNVLAIPLAALGVMHPVVAAAAMALSDVTVLGNSLRLSAVCRPRSAAAVTPRILPIAKPRLTP